MYVKIRRRHHANQTYEYVDIVESVRIDGKVVRRRLGTLGQRQDLSPDKVETLIDTCASWPRRTAGGASSSATSRSGPCAS
jgi:hypothetical protein